ncbi:MAG: hypothetical protein K0U98_00440 [Deltaproteobacteria bacterium]|nr:hypothetical protein [Deltaproteobacteria bacterium]
MPPTEPPSPPSPKEIKDLHRLAAGIIRTQGNRFIKELLRAKKIPIGSNKADFERNLKSAIEQGQLRLADVEAWLEKVEGWGDQHVYLYNLSPQIQAKLDPVAISKKVREAALTELWNKPTLLEFPEAPTLTSIAFKDSVLRLVWQESSPGWTPVPNKNYTQQEGLDFYEYRAFRKVERRAVTRFEAHLPLGLGALFVAKPIQGGEHQAAVAEVKRVLDLLIPLKELETNQVDISVVSRNLDQRNIPTKKRPKPSVRTQKSRLAAGGSYVEFAASSKDKAYWQEPAIQGVRKSVRTQQQLNAFQGMDGVFLFQPGSAKGSLSRPLRVQLYGRNDRIRLWAQMDAGEVWKILTDLATYQ